MKHEDRQTVRRSRVTIVRGTEVYEFRDGARIPRWLEREANAAIRDRRATVTFDGPDTILRNLEGGK